jgi:hypothetical protein
MTQVHVTALRDIYSTLSSVQRRIPGERFIVDEQVAQELAAIDLVRVDGTVAALLQPKATQDPKPEGALDDGPKEQVSSSSQVAQASRSNKSTMSVSPTKRAGAKRSS